MQSEAKRAHAHCSSYYAPRWSIYSHRLSAVEGHEVNPEENRSASSMLEPLHGMLPVPAWWLCLA